MRRSSRSGSDETLHRVAASVDAIAARLEAAERRSTVAIQGVDQAVSGLVRRMEAQDQQVVQQGRRIEDISEELKEGHRRLRTFEREVGPKSVETLTKVEQALGTLAGRLYDIEERQRTGLTEARLRLDGFEKTDTAVAALTSRLYDIEERQRASGQSLVQRLEAVEKAAGAGAGSELLARVGQRLDAAQSQTTEALRNLERSFAGLDQRLRAAESRVEPDGVRQADRFEKLAESLSRQVESSRTDMMRRLDTAENEGRMGRIEATVQSLGEQARAAEERSARGIEAMGREVLRIAQNLDTRVDRIETSRDVRLDKFEQDITRTLSAKIEHDMGRYGQAVEQRLTRAEDQHAIALEKLGVEITRISDRLADRIAQSERKSAQALEDISRRMVEGSDRIEQRYERVSGELSERLRLSEERTARQLAEARQTQEVRLAQPVAVPPLPEPAAFVPPAAPAASEFAQPDWRSATFPGDPFDKGSDVSADGWSIDPLSDDFEPFPSAPTGATSTDGFDSLPRRFEPAEPGPAPDDSVFADPSPAAAAPFGGFGGADVSDVLDAIASVEPEASVFASSADAVAPARHYDDGIEAYSAETELVDPRRIKASMAAGAAAGRSASTRDTIEAARAAMSAAPVAEPPRPGFGLGLKRGGKSKLQERLDKQAQRGEGTVKKALIASVTGMAMVGGVWAAGRATGYDFDDLVRLTGLSSSSAEATPIAALALTPTTSDTVDAAPVDATEAQTLYAQAVEQLDRNDPAGVETLTRAANLGEPQAQLKLAGLYQTGAAGLAVDPAESRQWARRAAESEDAAGMHAYGMYLYDGVGGARNRVEALGWLKKAAGLGLVDSQYNVARLYENGDEGIAPNPTQAYRWYLIAARAGDPQAQSAVDRLAPTIPAAQRQTARAQAEAFATEALD